MVSLLPLSRVQIPVPSLKKCQKLNRVWGKSNSMTKRDVDDYERKEDVYSDRKRFKSKKRG